MIRTNPRHWGKVAVRFAQDNRPENEHRRVYELMTAYVKRGTNICDIGQRKIAGILEFSQRTVERRQDDLERWGWVRPIPVKRGMRGLFEMLSPAFEVVPRTVRATPVMRTAERTNSVRNQAAAWARVRDEREREVG